MHEFVVIADDFTGANDTGVQICKKGIPVRVLLDAAQVAGSEDSLVVDTESRVVSAQEAYDKVLGAVQAVMASGAAICIKRWILPCAAIYGKKSGPL